MKKNKPAVLMLFFTAILCFAFEGGGLLKTGIGFDIKKPSLPDSKTSLTLNHYDGITVWAKQNMDKSGNFNFNVQGSYLFSLKKDLKPKNEKAVLKHILDIELLKFSFFLPVTSKSNMSIEFGRYGLTDITKTVLDQQMDGVFISYTQPDFSCFFNLGYTGLLNAHTVQINSRNKTKNTNIYRLSPSFFQISGLFHVPAGKENHSIDFEVNSFIETKKAGASRTYFILSANGPIMPNLFFILSAAGGLMSAEKSLKPGFFVNGELNYYFDRYGAKIGGKTQWFSGGKFSFDTFTKTSASKMLFIGYSDLLKAGFNFSIKPINDLFIGSDFGIFCKGLHQKGQKFFTGFEWTAYLGYTLFEDISFGFDTGIFIDKNKNVDSKIDLKGTVSF
ncbi:hypothetical protein [Treponema pedis]|uniref:Uncharacterized protein n=1 Tax=Treponema pedis str. T A4 TaxID=1291379 RepID=S6A4P2_9SPIR|nr:hypothetical protein [Treponema pedis]AGT44611.1 hypothetical protein TPE_2137 [Treponema pedis str. T A4]QSI05283.1 hypothetical protein DYQ05_10345 [Treponema pedis]